MSDTHFIKNLKCAYCGKNNDFEEDAMKYGHLGLPCTFEFVEEFICDKCKEKNEIVMSIVAVKSKSQCNYYKIIKKDFDKWNEVKKQRDLSEFTDGPFPKEGVVWMCILGLNIGFEQNGAEKNFERPVLVVKKFNNQMYWIVPLSSKQKEYDFYFNFTDPNEQRVSAILAQMRLISVKRFVREMYRFDDTLFADVINALSGFLDKSKPRTGRGFSGPSKTEGTVEP